MIPAPEPVSEPFMKSIVALIVAVVALAVLVWVNAFHKNGHESKERSVAVAAAADTQYALEEILEEFRKDHPDINARATYGSSGNFYHQLYNQAPYDLFLSADVDYPRRLIRDGLAPAETEFLYGVGRLVVWVPKDSPIAVETLGIQSLLEPSVQKIAIANPRHAPYGRAAEDAMKSLGVYEKVQNRLVFGDSVIQAAHFVETGSAEIGIIGHSLAEAPAMRDKGRFWRIPLRSYPRREQGGVILNWAQDRAAAEMLRSYILGAKGKAILIRYGFFLPEE
jgi:molybdate transport system substrate-binding protein